MEALYGIACGTIIDKSLPEKCRHWKDVQIFYIEMLCEQRSDMRFSVFIFHHISYILSSIFLYKFGCAIVVVRRRSLDVSFSAPNIFSISIGYFGLFGPYIYIYISSNIERKWTKTKANGVRSGASIFDPVTSVAWVFCRNLQRIIHLVCIASGTRRPCILRDIETHTHTCALCILQIISHGIQIR